MTNDYDWELVSISPLDEFRVAAERGAGTSCRAMVSWRQSLAAVVKVDAAISKG